MLLVSAVLLSTASYAWFSMNTKVKATGIELEAYSDSLFLEISQSETTDYGVITTVEGGKKATRLTNLRKLETGALVLDPEEITTDVIYSPSNSDTKYYKKLEVASSNDSFDGDTYLLLNEDPVDTLDGILSYGSNVKDYYSFTDGEIEFDLVTVTKKYKDVKASGELYYKKEANSYILYTPADDEIIFGLYTIEFGEKAGGAQGNDVYFNGGRYFDHAADGNVYPVGGLFKGTDLKGYYTIDETQTVVHDLSQANTLYHVEHNGNYISLGKIGDNEGVDINLKSYTYWVRAYSNSIDDALDTELFSVINTKRYVDEDTDTDPATVENPYYLYDEFYLKKAIDTNHGKNLRVSNVTVMGEDSLTESLRIFFVATNKNGEVARAEYNNNTKLITHWDNKNADGEGILFDTILGNEEEIITVQVYFYFDGTDPCTKNKDFWIVGHAIDLEFAIDKPEYIKDGK